MPALITAVLPTFRRPHLLKRAIQSVQKQTLRDFTLFICDNASNDGTEELVRKLMSQDSRIDYYSHKINCGAVNNFLFGLTQVKTPFFSFLSDDDLLFPSFYEIAHKSLMENPEAGFFVGLTVSCTPDGKVCKVPLEGWSREGLYYPEEGFVKMAEGHLPIWTGILFRREVIEKIGLLDPKVGSLSDFDFLLRAAAHFPFVVCKKECGIFLCHPTSVSSTIQIDEKFEKDPWEVFEAKIMSLESVSYDARKQVQRLVTHSKEKVILSILKRSLKAKDFAAFDQYYARAKFLKLKEKRAFRLRRFLSKYMPFFVHVWTQYKEKRRALKRSFNKKPSSLELLGMKYGDYSQWLTIDRM
jgi:glycosyltransferase involved in cell wall biosynthesis